MSEADELAALRSSRLMVSGSYRVPFTLDSKMVRRLIKKGLLTEGGYLTPDGLRARKGTSHG